MPDYIPFPSSGAGNSPSRQIPSGLGNGFYPGQEIFVRVTATNPDADNSPLVESSAAVEIEAAAIPPAGSWSFDPLANAVLTVGDEVEADWNAAGLPVAANLAYLWEISDDGSTGWSTISGASGTTYTIVASDETKFIRVTGTATSLSGGTVETTRTWTNAVQGTPFDATITWDFAGGGNPTPINVSITGDPGIVGLNVDPIRWNTTWGDFIDVLFNIDTAVYPGGADEVIALFGADSRAVITLSSGEVFDWQPSVNTALPEFDSGPINGLPGTGTIARPQFKKQGVAAGGSDWLVPWINAYSLLEAGSGGSVTMEFVYSTTP